MKRRIATGAVIATGLLGVGVPAASAHTAKLKVSGVCQDDGTRLVTYTGTTTNVPGSGAGHVATLTAIAVVPTGSAIYPSTQTVTGNTTYTFTQTISGSEKTAKATARLAWGDKARAEESATATFTEHCKPVVPSKPAPAVEVTHVDATNCDARTVTTTTTTTTTDWVLNVEQNTWVKGTPVATQKDTTRDATLQECPIIVPEKPAPVVEVTHADATDCGAEEVTTTTTTTTTDWVLDVDENEWVEGIPPEVAQDVAAQEATVEDCPVTVLGVSADAPAIVAPVHAVAANPLPVAASAGQVSTSGQLYAGGLTAFAAFLAFGAGFVLRRRHGEI